MPVRILEEHVVNQIAAGEVVERPASVVRELFQNALDAGASRIEVVLKNGGMSLVRVVDDGSGMNRTDAMMALERHATSKIHRAEDLQAIDTLGFRGEALPSIAAVSRFELRTRLHDEDEGTRIRVEGGTLRDVSPIGCAPGTEIDVRSLFFNLPARRKFLRTRTTELNHCLASVTREILLRPELDVTLVHEEREVLRAPRASDLVDRVVAVLGEVGSGLLPVDLERDGVGLYGRVAPIGIHRATAATAVYLYVNGRYVQDRLLRRAVYEAWRGRVPRGRYPLVVLDVRVPPEAVDVNVHPTKTEVRFTEPSRVLRAAQDGLREVLDGSGRGVIRRGGALPSAAPGPLFARTEPETVAMNAGPPVYTGAPVPEGAGRPAPRHETRREPPRPLSAHPDDDPGLRAGLLAAEPGPGPAAGWRALRVIGLLARRYLLAERQETLWLVDPAAARAALWRHALEGGEPPLGPSQRLLAPARVGVDRPRADRLEERSEALSALGVEIERFAPAEVAVRGLPVRLGRVPPAVLIEALSGPGEEVAQALIDVAAAHQPPPDDPTEWRTLFATLDEAGVPVAPPVATSWEVAELARRLGRSS